MNRLIWVIVFDFSDLVQHLENYIVKIRNEHSEVQGRHIEMSHWTKQTDTQRHRKLWTVQ